MKIKLFTMLLMICVLTSTAFSDEKQLILTTQGYNEREEKIEKVEQKKVVQYKEEDKKENEFSQTDPLFKLSYKKLYIKDRLDINYFGFRLDAYADDWISVYWSFYIGENSIDKSTYGHVPLGFFALLLASTRGGNNEGLALLLFLPEGIAFHIKPTSWLDISPFIGFGVDASLDHSIREQSNFFSYGLESGLRLSLTPKIGNSYFNASSFFNYYRDLSEYNGIRRNGFNFGFDLGVRF